MIVYNGKIVPIALPGNTTTPILTVIAGATRSFLVLEIDAEGMNTASAANEMGVYRVGTAGVTGGTAVTFVPIDLPVTATAFSGTAFGTYSTQPVLGALIHNIPVNANGQRYFWRANPNLNNAIVVPGGNNAAASIAVAATNAAYTSTIALRLQIAEL